MEADELDNDMEILTGSLSLEQEIDDDCEDTCENILESDLDTVNNRNSDEAPGELNSSNEDKPIHYLVNNGQCLYKPTVISKMLQSQA